MPQKPIDYAGCGTSNALDRDLWRFRWGVIASCGILNALLLAASIHEYYFGNGINNLLAILIAIAISPILNGLALLFGVVLAIARASQHKRRVGSYLAVAVAAPIAGIVLHVVVALSITPWNGPSPFTG